MPFGVFTLKDLATSGYILGLSRIGEVSSHMLSHHYAYFITDKFREQVEAFDRLVAGHEEDHIDLHLSKEEQVQLDNELAEVLNGK